MPLIIAEVRPKHATTSVMGESERVASLTVLIEQCLPYRIKMTNAVQTATLVDTF